MRQNETSPELKNLKNYHLYPIGKDFFFEARPDGEARVYKQVGQYKIDIEVLKKRDDEFRNSAGA